MFKVKRSSKSQKPGQSTRTALAREAIVLSAKIEAMKPMYARLDEILNVLDGGEFDGSGYTLVDKFQAKNSAWKSVCFRRFELVRGGK